MKMTDRLYKEQHLITSEKIFGVTAQGFIQCVSSIIADFEQQQEPELVTSDHQLSKGGTRNNQNKLGTSSSVSIR